MNSIIFVSNLPENTRPRTLYTMFEPFGDIRRIDIPFGKKFNTEYAFVEFDSDSVNLQYVIRKLNRTRLQGLEIKVEASRARNEQKGSFGSSRLGLTHRALPIEAKSKTRSKSRSRSPPRSPKRIVSPQPVKPFFIAPSSQITKMNQRAIGYTDEPTLASSDLRHTLERNKRKRSMSPDMERSTKRSAIMSGERERERSRERNRDSVKIREIDSEEQYERDINERGDCRTPESPKSPSPPPRSLSKSPSPTLSSSSSDSSDSESSGRERSPLPSIYDDWNVDSSSDEEEEEKEDGEC